MSKRLLIIGCFLSLFSNLLFAQDINEDKTALRKVIDEVFDAMRAADSTRLKQTFHSDAKLFTVGQTKEGETKLHEQPVQSFLTAVGTPHDEVYDERIYSYKYVVDGDFASVATDYAFYLGENFLHCGVNNFQFMRTKAGWKIISITDTRRKEGCDDAPEEQIHKMLDAWHNAAATAEEDVFFGSMTPDCVYIGTDPSERWFRDELKEWSKKYFERDKAWAFTPSDRIILFDDTKETAWFDEKLDTWMGTCLGSGVVQNVNGEWKLKHYHLAFTVKNEYMDNVLKTIAKKDTTTMDFEEYNPVSTLVVPENKITQAKFPFIDVHSHQWRMPEQDLHELAKEMDALNMKVMVNLSGRGFKMVGNKFDVQGSEYLERSLKNVKKNEPKRFILFTNLSWIGFGTEEWTKNAVKQLKSDVKMGANGLKIYKNLGFSVKDTKGDRVAVDDPRLDPVWEACGELGIPVLIHAADPKQFWMEHDKDNERWLELKTHPRRKRSATDPAPWEQIIQEQHNLFKKNSNTKFIAAHMAWYANDLDTLGQILDALPNVYVEIGAVIAELGRQPKQANKFFDKYQDRVLFGKDSYKPEEYPTYFRVLESEDEYFPYYKKYHAFWRMYGLGLPDEILKKLYYKNALKVIPNIDASLFPED